MTHTSEADQIEVAHDGDWYYLVMEDKLDLVKSVANQVINRKTRLGRYLAGRQLRSFVGCKIDLAVDDTWPDYTQSQGLTDQELSREVLKVTSVE